MGMRVYVSGASGFIGSFVTRALRDAGHDVLAGVSGADAVVHLAAIAHRRATVSELEQVNVHLAERTAKSAAAEGASFVYISSVKVHGETSEVPLRETSPIEPADPYAASKARAEEALRGMPGLPLAILRPPLVYGPGVKANFLGLMRAVARGWPLPLADLGNRRSLIYVGNLADAVIRCLGVQGTFLVSDGTVVSTTELCREIGDALRRPARLFQLPVALLPRKVAGSLEIDDSAIRRTLHWEPPFTREQGLKATANWYLAR